MPPRRRAGNPTGAQSTLSFGSQARVTKPVTAPSTKAKILDSRSSISNKSTSTTPEPQLAVTTEPSKQHVAELAVRQQPAAEVQPPQNEQDKQALNLNKQDIWRYWRNQEQIRIAPRGKSS
jgi:DNA polymerase delta subunit 4